MATTTKVIVQVHERVTEVQIDADLQSREIGFISGAKVLRVSEDDGTKHNIWAQDSSAVVYDNLITLSSTTASQALFTDGSKGVVSNALTGTGNVVMSASPTLTGTITAVTLNLSGSLDVDVNLNVDGDAIIDGNVGIGTSSPEALLNVFDSSAGAVTANGSAQLVIEKSTTAGINLLGGTDCRLLFGIATDNDHGGIVYDAANGMQFRVNASSQRIVFAPDGKVGIGIVSPAYKTDVLGSPTTVGASRAEVFISEDNTASNGRGGGIAFGRSTVVYGGIGVRTKAASDTNTKMHFSTRLADVVTEQMTIDSTGDVNILNSLDVDIDLNVDGDAVIDGDITISVDNKKLLLGASGYGQLYQTANATILYNTAFGGSDGDLELSCGLNGKVILSADLGNLMTIDSSAATFSLGSELLVTEGILALKENTTPSAVAGWGRVYTKTDDTLYFQDGAGAEKKVITGNIGTYTATLDGGFATDPTGTTSWSRAGNIVTMRFPVSFTGTTNSATSLVITGMPTEVKPLQTQQFSMPKMAFENGVRVDVKFNVATSGTISLTWWNGSTWSSTWSTAATTGLESYVSISYNIG